MNGKAALKWRALYVQHIILYDEAHDYDYLFSLKPGCKTPVSIITALK